MFDFLVGEDEEDEEEDSGVWKPGSGRSQRVMHASIGERDSGNPLHAPRHCTDLAGCLLFVIFFFGLIVVYVKAFQMGQPLRLLAFPNSKGEVCGVTQSVKDANFFYICRAKTGGLSPSNSVCLSECPTEFGSTVSGGACSSGDSDATDYPTKPVGGRICMPFDQDLQRSMSSLSNSRRMIRLAVFFADLERAWPLLLTSIVFAIIAGRSYMWMLDKNGHRTFICGAVSIGLLTCGFGAWLIWSSSRASRMLASSADLWVGITVLVAGFVGVCVCLRNARHMRLCFAAIESAAECMLDVPFFTIEPLFDAIRKLVLALVYLLGLVYLGTSWSRGTNQEIHLDGWTITMLVYQAAIFLWMLEMCSGISFFVVSYLTQEWYHADYIARYQLKEVHRGSWIWAYETMLRYHSGTIIWGSLVILVLRPAREVSRGLLHILQFFARIKFRGGVSPKLYVCSPFLNKEVSGWYILEHKFEVNGRPCWNKEESSSWLYYGTDGYWYIDHNVTTLLFNSGGYVCSDDPHFGMPQDYTGTWCTIAGEPGVDGIWVADSTISVEVKAFQGLAGWIYRWMTPWSGKAYMDVAMSAESFCRSARDVELVLTPDPQETGAFQTLYGVTLPVQGIGVLGVGTLCAALTRWACLLPFFRDISSTWYIADPVLVSCISGIIAMTIVYSFVLVFDQILDSLVYCKAIEQWKDTPKTEVAKVKKMMRQGCGVGMLFSDQESTDDRPAEFPPKTQALMRLLSA